MRFLSISFFILLLSVIIVPSGHTKNITESSLKEYLQNNPEIILDVLRENSTDLLAIVVEGAKEEADAEIEAQIEALEKIWETEKQQKAAKIVLTNRPYLGSKNAPVTMVAFSDFLCPYCYQASNDMNDFISRTPNVKYVYKNYSKNPTSQMAYKYFIAIASISQKAAWDFLDIVFANQNKLLEEKENFIQYAVKQVGQTPKKIKMIAESKKVADILKEDMKEGASLDIKGTPTLLINGRYTVLGAVPFEVLEYANKYALENK